MGQRVGTILFQRQCRHCINCEIINDIRFCENAEYAGLKINGGMAEYMLCDADSIMSLPASISFEQGAPLMCAGVSRLLYHRWNLEQKFLADELLLGDR